MNLINSYLVEDIGIRRGNLSPQYQQSTQEHERYWRTPTLQTQKQYSVTNNLNNANPGLSSSVSYSCINQPIIESDDDIDIDNTTLNECKYDYINTDINPDDYLTTDDDIITNFYDSDDSFEYPDYDYHDITPTPIFNLFMHHPHYNNKNEDYQRAMNMYIQGSSHCFTQTSDDEIHLDIPMNVVDVPIIDPEDNKSTINITAAADNGSDVQAMGITPTLYYKEKGLVRHDNKGIVIATGNGKVHVYDYVLIVVKSIEGKLFSTKFWCLESLPTHNFLIGRHLLHKLGWELTNRFHVWEHQPHNLDYVNKELDDLLCTECPFEGEKIRPIDFSKVIVKDPELEPFVHHKLKEYHECVAKHEWDSGTITNIPEFEINFKPGDDPLKDGFMSKEYWTNEFQRGEMQRQIDGMKEYEKIEICTHPQFVSPIFCVSKKTGDLRIVFDYRKLNQITEKHLYPIPDTTELLHKFRGKEYITSLDLKGGYWHIPIKASDRHKTAFVFNGDIYQWKVMPFGPTNAPMFFQQSMEIIFGDLDFVTVYLDDISILSNTLQQHKEHLTIVFELLKKHNIKLRIDKCLWGVKETEYLGFIVDKRGIKCKAKYVQKIMDVPRPKTKTQLKRFLGLVQFLHQFLPQIHNYISTLSALTSNTKPDVIDWTDEAIIAFNELKQRCQSVDTLTHPDMNKPFHVFTDASKYGLGGMLAQEIDGKIKPVAYCSKVFTDIQTRWHVSEQELYAAIYCVERWSSLLRYKKFILHTDHKNLQKLFNTAMNFRSGKLFRWAVRLQDYHFECRYIKGKDNIMADYLSREAVLTQISPAYETVNKFYQSNTTHHKTREILSNNGGIDILRLYTRHHHIEILNNNTNAHYFHNADPYRCLLIQYNDSITKSKYQITESKLQHFNQLPIHNNDIHCIPLKGQDKDVMSMTTDPSDLAEKLVRIPSPSPYVPPAFPEPDVEPTGFEEVRPDPLSNKTVKLRRSKRIQAKNKNKNRYEYRYKKLVIDDTVPLRGTELEDTEVYNQRESARKEHKETNQEIIDKKPYEPVWNEDLLRSRYYVPIRDDYQSIFDEAYKIRSNFIRFKQIRDPFCFAIMTFLNTGNKALILDLPRYIQRYILSGRFVINRYKLLTYKHTRDGLNHVYIPSSLLSSLLNRVHSKFHHGSTKMYHIITDKYRYWWPRMKEHISIYAKCCNTCQHIKSGVHNSFKKGGMKLFVATRPFEQISVDIVGPLPTTRTGNRYIVTIIDKFSRYCMLNPVADITALSTIKAIDNWTAIFGPPKSILSDNGPQFISAIYQDYMENHGGVNVKYTTTYHPQCNGQIERLHRWVKQRLSLISYDGGLNFVDGRDDWSDYLNIIQYTYNSTPNRMTSYSPMEIVLGRDKYKIEEYKFNPNNPAEYMDFMIKRQTIIRNNANERQQIYDKIRTKAYNKNKSTKKYEIGDRVLWNINARFTGNAQKLGPKWIGPYEIIDIKNDYQTYKLRVIPLPPNETDNPMNKHQPPKRYNKHERHAFPVDVFNVPREQIKPYYDSYESQFNGVQSPMQIVMNYMVKIIKISNQESANNNKYSNQSPYTTKIYYKLFYLYQQQLSYGYTPSGT